MAEAGPRLRVSQGRPCRPCVWGHPSSHTGAPWAPPGSAAILPTAMRRTSLTQPPAPPARDPVWARSCHTLEAHGESVTRGLGKRTGLH